MATTFKTPAQQATEMWQALREQKRQNTGGTPTTTSAGGESTGAVRRPSSPPQAGQGVADCPASGNQVAAAVELVRNIEAAAGGRAREVAEVHPQHGWLTVLTRVAGTVQGNLREWDVSRPYGKLNARVTRWRCAQDKLEQEEAVEAARSIMNAR
jgi:hypothetical protein